MIPVTNKDILKDLEQWIEYVATTTTSNDWPICPYAKKAKMDQQVRAFFYDFRSLDTIVDNFKSDTEKFKVWIFICKTDFDVAAEAKSLNDWYRDVIWLYDFADTSGVIGGVETGNKKYNLLLLQDKEELLKLSKVIKERGYYSNWSDEYYQQIVAWRTDDKD